MNTFGVSILLILMVIVVFAKRRWALLGMMAGVLYLTQYQAIEVAGFNLFAMRFLEIAGFARVLIRREFSVINMNPFDRLFMIVYIYVAIIFLLRATDGQAYQVGVAVDAILCYTTFRGLIGDLEDFSWFLKALVILLIPYVALLFIEMKTSQNPFSILGATTSNNFREGRIRCTGSFRNSSLLGTFGASFFPLYLARFLGGNYTIWGLIGIVLCTVVVLFSNSGGPVAAFGVGLVGWLLWLVRGKMKTVRRCMLGLLCLLALSMKAPVWFLLARLSDLTGGDGYHRSHLLDMAIKNFREWWLFGMPVTETAGWFPYVLTKTGGADMTNQFVSLGIAAGLMAIILFVYLLIRSFQKLGKTMGTIRPHSLYPTEGEYLLWGFGVVLVVHISNWFGIVYFDQTYVVWYMQLAAIVNLSSVMNNFQSPNVKNWAYLKKPSAVGHV